MRRLIAIVVLAVTASQAAVVAQRQQNPRGPRTAPARNGAADPARDGAKAEPKAEPKTAPPIELGAAIKPPTDYVIGVDDVLQIVFWRDADMSREVMVRPDGMITLPLVNDIMAVGLKPEELRQRIQEAAAKLVEDPTPSVTVKQINSRKVQITGEVQRPAQYNLTAPLRVMQLIGIAGGLTEYAKRDEITVLRDEGGQQRVFTVNFDEVARGKKLEQNIYLHPGDLVIVNGG